MKKILSVIMFIAASAVAMAQTSEAVTNALSSVFIIEEGNAQLRSPGKIQSLLTSNGFTAGTPVAATVSYIVDFDSQIKVKSTKTTYTNSGIKVTLNTPNAAKYKNQCDVSLFFPNRETLRLFLEKAGSYGFVKDDSAVDGENYTNDYYFLSVEGTRVIITPFD